MYFLWIENPSRQSHFGAFSFWEGDKINEIARKSTGFRGVRWACIWDTPMACSQREFYGKVDAKLEVKRLESEVQRTVAVSITYAAKMIAGRG